VSDALAILDAARERTLAAYGELPDEILGAWPDPEFSPLCWHLGHIAFTEAHWLLAKVGGDGSLSVPHARRYAQDGCAKAERNAGYEREALFAYLDEVRETVRERYAALPDHPLMEDDYLARFLANHERQHRETMGYVLGCFREKQSEPPASAPVLTDEGAPARVAFSGGETRIGTGDRYAYDNERGAHTVTLAPFALDAHPVTAAAWQRLIEAGGYQRRELWSDEGWRWREAHAVEAPKGWRRAGEGFVRVRLDGSWALDGREPVVGISAHEAEAYARFVGGRLPTETELEHAMRVQGGEPRVAGLSERGPMPVLPSATMATDLLGNVWEWTASAFAPYPGFEPHPYRGYSTPYFDGVHRVLRGGSFATDPAIARATFRNWYVPGTRQIFAGVRVAFD
jgi:iron(II)-dependent oxidoreductase